MRSFLLHKETKTFEGSFLAECVGGNESVWRCVHGCVYESKVNGHRLPIDMEDPFRAFLFLFWQCCFIVVTNESFFFLRVLK